MELNNNLASYNADQLRTVFSLCKQTTDIILSKNETEYLADIKDMTTLKEFEAVIDSVIESKIKERISSELE